MKNIIVGAIYDFCGQLTTQKKSITVSSNHHPQPILDAIKIFFKKYNLDSIKEPHIKDWNKMICSDYFDKLLSGTLKNIRDDEICIIKLPSEFFLYDHITTLLNYMKKKNKNILFLPDVVDNYNIKFIPKKYITQEILLSVKLN